MADGSEDSAKAPPKTKPSPYREVRVSEPFGPSAELRRTRMPNDLAVRFKSVEELMKKGIDEETAKSLSKLSKTQVDLNNTLNKRFRQLLAPSVGEYSREDRINFENIKYGADLVNEKTHQREQEILKAFKPGPRGLKIPGTIDIHNRPVVKNEDGTISTVRSISIGTDKGEVLIPTISDEGKTLTPLEAIHLYKETGAHLGIFETPEDATAYAKSLHEQQAQEYGGEDQNVEEGLKDQLITPGGLRFPKMIKGGELSPKGNK